MTQSITLLTLPSGKIELVQDEQKTLMQFNCDCMDALPYCHALCCRMRPYYNAEIEPHETTKFEHFMHKRAGKMPLPILAHNDKHCNYLDSDACSCKVHEDKPIKCKEWHCSPGGVGEGITKREQGWILIPQYANMAQKKDE